MRILRRDCGHINLTSRLILVDMALTLKLLPQLLQVVDYLLVGVLQPRTYW